jgi:hypothetical protein
MPPSPQVICLLAKKEKVLARPKEPMARSVPEVVATYPPKP